MKKIPSYIIGVLIAFCLIFAALVTAVEAVCYWTPGYFETEYEKHDVLASLPEMTMSDEDGLMAVTNHMMKYLRGDADTPELQIEVMMDGKQRGFFTEREILHMEDVRDLFVGAQMLRTFALILVPVLSLGLYFGRRQAGADAGTSVRSRKTGSAAEKRAVCERTAHTDSAYIKMLRRESISFTLTALARGMLLGCGIFLLLAALLGAVVATDFSNAFVTFHHIFFDNDLWILDPSVDMLVNIVPEGFFFDTALRILLIFAGTLLLLCAVSFFYLRHRQRNLQEKRR